MYCETSEELVDKFKKEVAKVLKTEHIFFKWNGSGDIPYFNDDYRSDKTYPYIGRLTIGNILGVSFTEMPSCCGIVIASSFYVTGEHYFNESLWSILDRIAENMGYLLGYSSVFITDIDDNITHVNSLDKNNWTQVRSVVNSRTGNNIIVFTKDIKR